MHHIAGRHEVLGPFVDLGTKAADQVLIEVAHHAIRHRFRVQIDSGEILANLKEDTGLVEPKDGVREVELLEDDSGVVREVGDVVLKVLASFRAAQIAQGVFGGVVERVAGCLPEH
ncbi:hypothetical protein SDC9_161825 [bioreactor metagenome]|uniref:Uncharacterized protein n=1 Tax=bioreactor metagenome TaxID=1076179 RepID=A0A645FJB7_9ZZZZ